MILYSKKQQDSLEIAESKPLWYDASHAGDFSGSEHSKESVLKSIFVRINWKFLWDAHVKMWGYTSEP